MIVIYHDVGGTHSAATSAAMHLNCLPTDTLPDIQAILNTANFDQLTKTQRGKILYIGKDEFNNDVYTLCRQYTKKITIPALKDMFKIAKGNTDELILVDTSPTVNNWMRLGGFSSRRLNLISFGRPIVAYGTRKACPKIAQLVKETKIKVSPPTGPGDQVPIPPINPS